MTAIPAAALTVVPAVTYGCCEHCDHDRLVPRTMPPHTRKCRHEDCKTGQTVTSAPRED